MRIAACVEYDGSAYSGWQYQPHAPNVQAVVELALSNVADHPVRVHSSGRTDAGVHALGQVIHFDAHVEREPHSWVFGANSQMPRDVALRWAQPVDADFHARYAATERHYRYLIHNHPARSALFAPRAAHCRQPLDAARMADAAAPLVGEHDFNAFRAAGCQAKSPMRDVRGIEVRRVNEFVVIDMRANAFLHHMVRNIVGTLIPVGRGAASVDWPAEVLAGGDRRCAGVTAPAQGLYFVTVAYPARFGLPAHPDPALLLPADTG